MVSLNGENHMKTSKTIGEISAALSNLQGAVVDASKDKKAYNYMYATLSSVLEIACPLLAKNGLSLTQHPEAGEEKVKLTTFISHKSGEWMRSTLVMPVPIAKNLSQAQSTGSVISYCRRYALAAVLGITQQDDDAATGQGGKRVNREAVQGYMIGMLEALERKDATGMLQLHDELKDTTEQSEVWRLFNTRQKSEIKTLLFTLTKKE